MRTVRMILSLSLLSCSSHYHYCFHFQKSTDTIIKCTQYLPHTLQHAFKHTLHSFKHTPYRSQVAIITLETFTNKCNYVVSFKLQHYNIHYIQTIQHHKHTTRIEPYLVPSLLMF